MATEIIKTIKSSGGDYTSRAAFEAAVPANLVTLDEQWSGVIDAFEDTTAVTVAGITTDATRYIEFRVASGQGHAGKWDATKARIIRTVQAAESVYNLSVNYTRIVGEQVRAIGGVQDGSFLYYGIVAGGTIGIRITKSIVDGDFTSWSAGTTRAIGIHLGTDVAGNQSVINTIVSNFTYATVANGWGIRVVNHTSGKSYVYNVTLVDCGNCIEDGFNDIVCKNVITKPASGGSSFVGAFDASSDYNASSTATAPGANSRINQTFTFVDETGDDFHLASGDAGAKDAGTDLSGDANYPFSDDIDGQTRSGSWDIGADEYVAAGGGAKFPTPHLWWSEA